MKAAPYKWNGTSYEPCEVAEVTHIYLNLPGPTGHLKLPVITHGSRAETPCWSWNGDMEKPTLKPSILTTGGNWKCHTFVNDGLVQFLGDCTHELAGKTVELLEVDL